MVRITFLDGSFIDVSSDTPLIGINNCPMVNEKDCFYLQQSYNWYVDKGLSLSTVDERLGITGFLLSHDCFSIGDGIDKTIYMRSAVKSISVI